MAINKKKEEPVGKTVVSKIPMPPSDSALVIDLPDGQKLVIGKMEHGTVIEVATWRGTGRPDSRTNRMMLGMTNSELEATIEAAATGEAPVNEQELKSKIGSIKKDPKQFFLNIFGLIFVGIKWLFNFKDQFGDGESSKQPVNPVVRTSSENNSPEKAKKSFPKFDLKSKLKKRESGDLKIQNVDKPSSKDSELEDWLDQIMTKAQAKVDKSAANDTTSSAGTKKVTKKAEPTAKKSKDKR